MCSVVLISDAAPVTAFVLHCSKSKPTTATSFSFSKKDALTDDVT
jgi:hypothetical protein